MSRIGKLPIAIPPTVKVGIEAGIISVEGPRGKLSRDVPPEVKISLAQDALVVERLNEGRRARAMHGLARTLVNNMVNGVTKGFTKVLEIVGVGYRVEQKGGFLLFHLGYSHPILYELPLGIKATVEQNTKITLSGSDREVLGQAAATIRAFRPPEPYKGKGIRYAGEAIRSKVGKSGK
ncbi:MAG: 50S ribosomal protein L6 [Bradymonadales bacterium]|nr:50S ribosomal protein L6 [Bradymonadales bacterium]